MKFSFTAVLICILISTGSVAQSGFIELTVNDTMMLVADRFMFRLSANSNLNATEIDTASVKDEHYYRKKGEQAKERLKQRLKDLSLQLKNAGYNVPTYNLNDLSNTYAFQERYVQVYVNTVDSLKAFYNYMKGVKDVTTSLHLYQARSEEDGYSKLFQKLVSKAREKAKSLAATQGKTITGVLSIKDNRFYTAGWSAHPPYGATFAMPTFEIEDTPVVLSYSIQNSITVQFAWK